MQNMPRTSLKKANQFLINARLQRGWTQREAAEAVGTTLANVSRWERGVTFPSPYFRQKLCEVFKMNPEDLNLTRTQRYSSQIYNTKQKDFPMSHDRFWNFERMFFFLMMLLMLIILRAKDRRSLLKGIQLHSISSCNVV